MPYHKILCAVDLTAPAEHVHHLISKALDLSSSPSDITLIHVLEHPLTGAGELDTMATEDELMAHFRVKMQNTLAEYHLDEKQGLIALGNPAFDIQKIQQENHSDLVVLGRYKKAWIQRFLDSQSDNINNQVTCDTLNVSLLDL